MADQELSGSPAVNPKPGNVQIKDSAIHHKNLGSKTVREIIDESINDDTDPSASDTQAD